MTQVAVKPTSLYNNVAWTASAGGVLACVTDSSDATWVTDPFGGGSAFPYAQYRFVSALTLPARATIRWISPVVRTAWISTNVRAVRGQVYTTLAGITYASPSSVAGLSGSILNYVLPAGGEFAGTPTVTPQQFLDALEMTISNSNNAAAVNKVYDIWLIVNYNEAPTVTGLATDSVFAPSLTTKPAVKWTYNDVDSDPMAGYQVVTYPTSVVTALSLTQPWEQGVGGALPAGYVDNATITAAAVNGTQLQYQLTNALTNGTNYTTFVRVGDTAGGTVRYGPASSVAYTPSVVLPLTPVGGDMTPTYDASRQRVGFSFLTHLNQLPQDAADFEGGISNWGATTLTNCTRAQTGAQFLTGTKALAVTITGAGAASIDYGAAATAFYMQVVAGTTYTAVASFRAAATVRTVSIDILWYLNTGLLSTTTGAGTPNTTSGWTQVSASAAAPATANRAVIRLKWNGGAAAEVQYVDSVSFIAGTSTTWTQGVGGAGTLVLERSYDGGTTWFSVPTVTGQVPNVATGAVGPVYDVVLSPNRSTTYRMSVSSSVTISGQVLVLTSLVGPTSSPIVPAFPSWVLRDPTDVESEVVVPLMGDLQSSATAPSGRFKPLGASREVIVSDVSTGDTFSTTAVFQSQAAYDKFEALRKSVNTLLLQSDMTGVIYWVETGADRKATLYRRFGRIAAATRARSVDFDLIEVAAPTGQPAVG